LFDCGSSVSVTIGGALKFGLDKKSDTTGSLYPFGYKPGLHAKSALV